uniref:Serine/threonine-protein phosphatase n=1 Tax=Spongospora subterranea TaxID=70186 RepID=A0A0H5QIM9_9EUKA|eukprot:CRZ01171.1 hypothetical protein [Spongospora subterranea]
MTTTDIDTFIDTLLNGGLLHEAACIFICEKLVEILMHESNVHPVNAPVTVVGDIHGQLHDLFELFKVAGTIPSVNYLFLGDYVDRGQYSVPTISLLGCFKIRFPHCVAILRGNHESRQITQVYGFYSECCNRYGEGPGTAVWKAFTNMFDYLPIAAIIDDAIFCTHGGLSPSLRSVDQIRVLQRFQEIPAEGALADLMWSDPDSRTSGFRVSSRGAGFLFGEDIFDKFMEFNGFKYMVRAHQLCMEGYQELFQNRFATVWSAPNYCFRAGNRASVLKIDADHNKNFVVFDACPSNQRIAIQGGVGNNHGDSDGPRINPDYFL